MNLFAYIPVEHDATSFYRALQPLSHLRKVMPNLNLYPANVSENNKVVKLSDITHMDVAFIQRPSHPDHLNLINFCKTWGVKVWIDFDDNLFCVHEANPAHQLYENEQSKKTMSEALRIADLITVSTEALGMDLMAMIPDGKKIHVVPNAFNDYLFKETPVLKKHNIVMWRGGQSHQKDLHSFAPKIVEASQSDPNWLFHFMGYNPWFLMDHLTPRGLHTDGVDIMQYHDVIKRTYPNISIVTLSDTPFNRCKSNIAWIEGTYAGSVCLAPNWEVWRKPGIFTYQNQDEFGESLKFLMSMEERELQKYHALSWEYIQDKLRLSQVNKIRANLLQELVS